MQIMGQVRGNEFGLVTFPRARACKCILNENTDTTQSTGAGQSRCLTVFNYGGP